ncbi:hypothetical protein O2K51_00855 [Apibacter raozihei]|uniref:hypothetical protein n=1 Tax=Apibacter raozihei TaxID=2500547 RepID=UPI0013E3D02E|nr:hypothetical protein [Apibacter raozihei]
MKSDIMNMLPIRTKIYKDQYNTVLNEKMIIIPNGIKKYQIKAVTCPDCHNNALKGYNIKDKKIKYTGTNNFIEL